MDLVKKDKSLNNPGTLYLDIQMDRTCLKALAYTFEDKIDQSLFFFTRQNILIEYLWGPERWVMTSQSFALGIMQCSFEFGKIVANY